MNLRLEFFSLIPFHMWTECNLKIVLETYEQHLRSNNSFVSKIQSKSAEMAKNLNFDNFHLHFLNF